MVYLFVHYFDEVNPYDIGLRVIFILKYINFDSNFKLLIGFIHLCKTYFYSYQLYELFMNNLKLQMHLEVLKVGPTSFKDMIDKCLIIKYYEVRYGINTFNQTSNPSTSLKNNHVTKYGVFDTRTPPTQDKLLTPIIFIIK